MSERADWDAPEGKTWVCMCCGKISRQRDGGATATSGWDESCFLNAELHDTDRLVFQDGRVVKIAAPGESVLAP